MFAFECKSVRGYDDAKVTFTGWPFEMSLQDASHSAYALNCFSSFQLLCTPLPTLRMAMSRQLCKSSVLKL